MLRQAKAVTLYDQKDAEAISGVVDDSSPNVMVVWEGFLTRFITEEMHLSVPYYSSVTLALKRMGCIRQLRRGGGSSPSQWELITEPTTDLFDNALPSKLVPVSKTSQLQEQVDTLETRLKLIEDILENIIHEAEV